MAYSNFLKMSQGSLAQLQGQKVVSQFKSAVNPTKHDFINCFIW